MPKPARNDPCPCGSGLKYKRCCWRRDQVESRQLNVARQASLIAGESLFTFFNTRFAPRRRMAAWALFPLGDPAVLPDDHDMQVFAPWAMFHWQDGHEGPAARMWLDESPEARDPDLADFVRAALGEPFSFFEVVDVVPGRGIRVRDLLCPREMFMQEVSASRTVRRWHILTAKAIPYRGFWFFEGLAPTPLPPDCRDKIVASVLKRLGLAGDRPLEPEQLLDHSMDVLNVCREAIEDLLEQPRPTMTNTDNEMLVLCTTRYQFEPTKRPGIEALLDRIEGLEPADPGAGDWKTWVWSRHGNPVHPDWDNTSIGNVRVTNDELVLETNSRERDARLRTRLEADLGDGVRFVATEARDMNDPAEFEGTANEQGETSADDLDDDPIPPEIKQQILTEFLDRHYATWPDRHLPSLGGRTPREAVATNDGRTQVEAIIRSMEFHHDENEMPDFDYDRIRRDLGLAPVVRGKSKQAAIPRKT
jgi:hypothetical protein